MKKIFTFLYLLCMAKLTMAQNVGISNPAPTEKLQVDSGNIKIGNSVWNTTVDSKFLKFGDADYISIGEDESDDRLLIRAKNVILKPSSNYNGFVGINTPYPPASPLEIYSISNTSSPGLRLTQQGAGLGNYDGSWNIFCSGDGGVFSNYLYFRLFNNNRAFIYGADGSYNSVSDRRYKRDIHYLNDQTLLPKIMQLKPATYFMKEDTAGILPRLGFISQDMELLFPQVVTTADNIKMMNYAALIPILTKGIQEQQQQIDGLQKENQDLKMRLEKLEKMIQSK